MRALQDTPVSRWIMTYASDCRPGDLIRSAGKGDARRLLDRTYPELSLTFEATWSGGAVESIAKDRLVQLWDPTGEVAQRVRELSIQAIQ